nr:CBN-RRF-3 protein [Haemonchus contortus]
MQRAPSKIHFGSVFTARRGLAPETCIRAVGSFDADYAAKALVSRGCAVSDQLLDNSDMGSSTLIDNHLFFDRIRWCMKECDRACEEALENLLCAIDERRIMDLLRAFHQMYSRSGGKKATMAKKSSLCVQCCLIQSRGSYIPGTMI